MGANYILVMHIFTFSLNKLHGRQLLFYAQYDFKNNLIYYS